jgi:dual specificity phosphatase 12
VKLKAKMGGCKHCQKRAPVYYSCSTCLEAKYCGEECAHLDWIAVHAQEHEENAMDEIYPNVYLGAVRSIKKRECMNKVQAVVSALDEGRFPIGCVRTRLNTRYPGQMHHLRVTLDDDEGADIAQFFDLVADWVNEQVELGRTVLIHCVAGHSRSATLLIYYMLKYRGFHSVEKALEYVQLRRPSAQPNDGFMEQLKRANQDLGE